MKEEFEPVRIEIGPVCPPIPSLFFPDRKPSKIDEENAEDDDSAQSA
jgi:hypothetical protein